MSDDDDDSGGDDGDSDDDGVQVQWRGENTWCSWAAGVTKRTSTS